MHSSPIRAQPAARLPGWLGGLRRVLFFALIWWLLTGGTAGSWLIGGPMVVIASGLSFRHWVKSPISLRMLARFIPWFAYQSIAGASDVAWRAMRPGLPLRPGLINHDLRLPEGAPRIALANVVSMLAGTLSADLEGSRLVVHSLDTDKNTEAMLVDLEQRIAGVFDVELEAATGSGAAR